MWTKVGNLVLPSGRLSISDSSFFLEYPFVVDLVPGTYSIEVWLGIVGGHELIERLRIVDPETRRPSRGESLGYVRVEFAQLGVCDRTAVESALSGLDEGGLNSFSAQLSLPGLTGFASFPDGTKMFLLKPGAGDLDSAIFELLAAHGRCGVEAVFVEPEARTPA